jgi:hypothetical protein
MTDRRIHEIAEAPTLYPTDEEFADTFRYIAKIRTIGEKFGIVKIVPPAAWKPPFALEKEVCTPLDYFLCHWPAAEQHGLPWLLIGRQERA